MKIIELHNTNTTASYKNSICSIAMIIVIILSILSIILPVLVIYILKPFSDVHKTISIYEKPYVEFQFQSIFTGKTKASKPFVQCTHYIKLNKTLNKDDISCGSFKHWGEDFNNNGAIDKIHFFQNLKYLSYNTSSLSWFLLMKVTLLQKCKLTLPAIVTLIIDTPPMRSGHIVIDGELQLKQYESLICPDIIHQSQTPIQFPTFNPDVDFLINEDSLSRLLRRQLELNPAYFQFVMNKKQFQPREPEYGLTIQLDFDIFHIPVCYNLSLWERLGPIWLYFISFFILTHYIMNKLKDYLFSKHIIQSWEILPWKKVY